MFMKWLTLTSSAEKSASKSPASQARKAQMPPIRIENKHPD